MYALLDMVTPCTSSGQTYSHNSLVSSRGQIMTVKAHPGLCMKYSRWDICGSFLRGTFEMIFFFCLMCLSFD